MGVRVLHDADERQAALYDSVTMTAFGPLFDDSDPHLLDAGTVAECFLQWNQHMGNADPRTMTDDELSVEVNEFKTRLAEHPGTTVDYGVLARNLAYDTEQAESTAP